MKRISLTQKEFVLVDDDDFSFLNFYKWNILKSKRTFYAQRKENGKTVLMHREIMKTPENMVTDHIDSNGLNNQKGNLRICTQKENWYNQLKHCNNSSGFKGVYFHKERNKWEAGIKYNGKGIYLGIFNNKIEAAIAYNNAAKKYFGKYAKLNSMESTS